MRTEFLNIKSVSINDAFWVPFMERVRTEVIPYQWEALNDRVAGAEPSYCMRNFKIAAQMTHPELDYGADNGAGHGGMVFQDSDAAKWIEAAAYTLVWRPDAELEKTLDGAIDIICNAQQEDGYLNTYYIINGLEKRFTNLKDNHELYCLGHFIEAAVAYYEAAGKRKLLDAVIRYVDCVDALIGPEDGKLHGYPGHEIAEMALARLYEITKDEKHLKLAAYFVNQRGQKPLYFEEETKRAGGSFYWKDSYFQYQYYQAGKPVREQPAAEGHAVRAVYLYSGMADIARLTGDEKLLLVCEALFDNISQKQMYITGGIGQSAYGEAFSYDYSLPNDTVYAETCASIGLAFFARRMASVSPKGIYADVLERALYNGITSGMSLDGKAFFYVNPLEANPEASLKDYRMRHVKVERQKWFACACCPPNLARLISSLGSYIHSANDGAVYTHLYAGGTADFSINGAKLRLKTKTLYPWEGKVEIEFALEAPREKAEFSYFFRIPSWCKSYQIELAGEKVIAEIKDGYAFIRRAWQNGDKLTINFDMPVQVIHANPKVRENEGKIALMRGPLVYCMEEADNGKELFKISLDSPANFTARHEKGLLRGITVIDCAVKKLKDWKDGALYRAYEANSSEESAYDKKEARFIPYYAWANRGAGEMLVWLNRL